MKYVIAHDGSDHEVEITEREDGRYDVRLDGVEHHADLRQVTGEDSWSLVLDGRSYDLLMVDGDGATTVIHHGRSIDVVVESERERNARLIAADGGGTDGEVIKAVMPGFVVSVAVAEGDTVAPGDSVVVLEAMKMENEIRATSNGVVTRVAVAAGETVNAGDVLVEISAA